MLFCDFKDIFIYLFGFAENKRPLLFSVFGSASEGSTILFPSWSPTPGCQDPVMQLPCESTAAKQNPLAHCSLWGCKESDTIEQLNSNKKQNPHKQELPLLVTWSHDHQTFIPDERETAWPILGEQHNLLDEQLLNWGQTPRPQKGQVRVQSYAAGKWPSSGSVGLQGPHSKPGVHLHPDHLGSFTSADSDLGAWDSAFLAGSQVMHPQRPLWEYEWWNHYIILLPVINE